MRRFQQQRVSLSIVFALLASGCARYHSAQPPDAGAAARDASALDAAPPNDCAADGRCNAMCAVDPDCARDAGCCGDAGSPAPTIDGFTSGAARVRGSRFVLHGELTGTRQLRGRQFVLHMEAP